MTSNVIVKWRRRAPAKYNQRICPVPRFRTTAFARLLLRRPAECAAASACFSFTIKDRVTTTTVGRTCQHALQP